MYVRDFLVRAIQKAARVVARPDLAPVPSVASFAWTFGSEKSKGALASIFYSHDGRLVHKWDHYLPIYERYFARFRGKPVRILEIGVSYGGSLELWRKYFGPQAIIFGVDIDPRCRSLDCPDLSVRIGSQNDPHFLQSVIGEMGGIDIVIDDGSHVATHQKTCFETCFPLLSPDGLYVAEDLHTAYWPGSYEGGCRRRGTFIEEMKALIDDMHEWYYNGHQATDAKTTITAIHFHDSIVIIEKADKDRPFHVMVGRPSF